MKYVDKINKIISSVTGMEGPYANLIIDTLLIIIFVKIVQKVSYFFFSKIFKKNKTRFNFRKKVSFVCNIFLVFIIIIIWEDFLLKFITLFSFVTAAIAYSLRDTIINFFAGIYIRLAKPFQVEDRIMICNHIGDVVNISNLSFEVLEVNSDTFQSTGSIVHIPNSKVISEPLINYVKVFKYVWNETEEDIRQMLEELNIPFTEDIGEAAFYGPKVDINAKNVYGKEDTMITIQWDALLAEQFDMYYIDENGDKKRPCIIHRTSMGCYERTLAWLIEKYAGMFPTWLCPEQVRVIPISEKFNAYADKVEAQMKEEGIRCSVDRRSEKMGYKIREARLERVPYMLVVGAKEEEEGKVSVRSRYLGDEGMKDLGDFMSAIKEEIKNKTIRKIEVQEENK